MEKQWEVTEAVGGAVEPAVADADGVLSANSFTFPIRLKPKFGNGNVSIATASL